MKNIPLLTVLFVSLSLMLAIQAAAQTFSTLWNFTGGSDGASPYDGLAISGNMLYGTASFNGSAGHGTVFAINTDGTGFTNLYSFNGTDGAVPNGGLILSGNTLYGTTYAGGASNKGTVFKLNTDGTGFTNLYSFNGGSDGSGPQAGVTLSGNSLYGTATFGGNSGNGTVFAIKTDGTGFTNLHSFTSSHFSLTIFVSTNADGGYPSGGLIVSSNTLFGTSSDYGNFGKGTVFAINTDGTGFTNLYNFTGGSDGAYPYCGLILSGNTLYGTTANGTSSGNGTVFAINTDGTGFKTMHSFSALNGQNYTNSDGANPQVGLIMSGSTLYGTGLNGGSTGYGTVFAMNTDGSGFTSIYSFLGVPPYPAPYTNSPGTYPFGLLILSGNTLYGTANSGGNLNQGTVFSLSLPPPPLAIGSSGANVVLTWPTYAPGVTLESATNLVSPVAWSTVFPVPVLVNGQNTVTNSISGAQMFYRLSQ